MKTDSNYAYPLQTDWSTSDIVAVTNLYQCVEAAYEQSQGIEAAELMAAYRAFQKVVPQKFEEKQVDRDFQTVSGYSIYRTVQQAKKGSGKVKMKGTR